MALDPCAPRMKADGDGAAVVFVVDDDESVREALRRLFSSEGFAVDTFPSAQAFLDAYHGSAAPGCLLLDVFLPDLNGLEVQERLSRFDAPPAVVFLTGRGDIPMSVKAIKGGALEFFTKPFLPAELIAAVRSAVESQRAARRARADLADLKRRYGLLTHREREVMAGVAAGLANKQIAASFGTSEATVKEQRAQAMRKMGASSAAQLVHMSVKLGVAMHDVRPNESVP
ncbi:MAG TPA: response regulator [Polyangiaceae bacterium]